jgi:hypothetical protein
MGLGRLFQFQSQEMVKSDDPKLEREGEKDRREEDEAKRETRIIIVRTFVLVKRLVAREESSKATRTEQTRGLLKVGLLARKPCSTQY